MTKDFFLGQLRLIAVAVIAYFTGTGKLSSADGTLIGAVGMPLLLLFGPWLWSIYVNINMKIVPKDSIAIERPANLVEPVADGHPSILVDRGGNQAAVKVVGCLFAILFAGAFLISSPALAQEKRLFNPPVKLIQSQDDAGGDLLKALDAKLLPDLKYALNMAQAAKNDITANCYAAWIDLIEARAAANQGEPPNPAVITNFERAVEIRNALQPDSKFMIACSPVANMVKKDIIGFVGKIISGGITAGMLIPGL